MGNAQTSLIWSTLRAFSSWPSQYEGTFSDVAMALFESIPWYSWPKGPGGGTLYDSVLCLAYYSQETIDAWAKKHPECCYDVSSSRNTEPWYWIANWATRKRLSYYLENNGV